MKANDIRIGMILELKPERAEAYGFLPTDLYVTVTRIKERPGYKTPWIIRDGVGVNASATYEAFKPSDFKRIVVGGAR